MFDHRYSVKWNNNTLQSALTSLFTSIEDLLPNEASTNSSLNISMDTSKENLKTELDNILASLNSDCKADPCTYTVNTTAAVTETLESNWTSLTETKTDEAVTTVLRNAFTNFGKFQNIKIKHWFYVFFVTLKCLRYFEVPLQNH